VTLSVRLDATDKVGKCVGRPVPEMVLYKTVGVAGTVGRFHHYVRQQGVPYIRTRTLATWLQPLTMLSTPILS
jgi:hypothetical protein